LQAADTDFANLPRCLIGMEACGGAHHEMRKLQQLVHTIKLMAPRFVKPYGQRGKNAAADAQAIRQAQAAAPNRRDSDAAQCLMAPTITPPPAVSTVALGPMPVMDSGSRPWPSNTGAASALTP
jgi:hypothetical protein